MELKSVALEKVHVQLGAKMVPFAGFNMPVRYSSDKDEHFAVRDSVGVFDVSHMGEFLVTGEEALKLIQKISSNDASTLVEKKIQYACLPNGKGGIVDDFLVYKKKEDEYLLVVNASNIKKDWDWINSNNTFDAHLQDISDQYSLLAVQGPKAVDTLYKITEYDFASMAYYTFDYVPFEGLGEVFVSATGYTGAGGFEILIENEKVEALWNKLFECGAEFGIKPIGLGARDTLRLEKGYCLYGNDIDDTTSPIEAGLGWVTKFTKDFIDSDFLKAQKENGVTRKLVGFKMKDKGIPRGGYEIVDAEGSVIGKVTSGTISPVLNIGVGMGYVPTADSKVGSEIFIQVRNKQLSAEVVKFPFV